MLTNAFIRVLQKTIDPTYNVVTSENTVFSGTAYFEEKSVETHDAKGTDLKTNYLVILESDLVLSNELSIVVDSFKGVPQAIKEDVKERKRVENILGKKFRYEFYF